MSEEDWISEETRARLADRWIDACADAKKHPELAQIVYDCAIEDGLEIIKLAKAQEAI